MLQIFFSLYGSLMRGIICLMMLYTQGRSYKRLRNVVTLKLRKEKQRYFNEQLCETKGDSRVTWKNLKQLLGNGSKGLFTWSGGPRSSGVGFFYFHALEDTKQKKPTSQYRGPPLHVNRV